jgi:DNA polymerase-3 subunit delta'
VTLDQIIGQAVPVSILKRALSTNSLGHAYLFSGEEGVGKETTARVVAEELAKQGGPLSSLHVLGGEGSIKIEDIRQLRQSASLASAGNTVWLILDADRLTPEAGNALLKTLEEPVPGTHFFLTTTKVQSMLPTIVSRCQHLQFRRIPEEEICQWLAKQTQQSPADERIRTISRLAQGSLGKALAYWKGSLLEERETVISKLIQVPRASYPAVLGLSQTWPEDREKIHQELQVFLEWHRDLLTVKNGIDLPLYNPGYERQLKEISALYTNDTLFVIIEKIVEMGKAIAGNGRIRFCLGYLLLMMKRGALT